MIDDEAVACHRSRATRTLSSLALCTLQPIAHRPYPHHHGAVELFLLWSRGAPVEAAHIHAEPRHGATPDGAFSGMRAIL